MVSVGIKVQLDCPALSCIAEELCLAGMIDYVKGSEDEVKAAIDFNEFEDYAFEDLDHEWLFMDTPPFPMEGSDMEFDEWFTPFNEPRVMSPFAAHPAREVFLSGLGLLK